MNRTLNVSPIEPAALHGRATAGFDCVIDIVYRKAFGDALVTTDLAGTLVLTGRTAGQSTSYVVPATDVVNGRARAVIPGGDLSDDNGYLMMLVGTVDAARKVIAQGILLVDKAGVADEAAAVDLIDTVDLSFDYDENADLDVTLWQDAAGGSPYDLAAEHTTVSAYVYDRQGGTAIAPFTVVVTASNVARISLTKAQVNALPASCWWALSAAAGAGQTVLCEGSVQILGSITPPLETTVANYDYQKPATTGSPLTGQIVQATFTQDILQVAKIDHDGTDRIGMLRLLQVGDTITIGATVWSIGDITEVSDAFVFDVLPIQQAAPSGVVAVTFERPV